MKNIKEKLLKSNVAELTPEDLGTITKLVEAGGLKVLYGFHQTTKTVADSYNEELKYISVRVTVILTETDENADECLAVVSYAHVHPGTSELELDTQKTPLLIKCGLFSSQLENDRLFSTIPPQKEGNIALCSWKASEMV